MIMDFNVNVRLDATPALVGCVNTLATAIGGAMPQVRELPSAVVEPQVPAVPAVKEPAAAVPAEEKPSEISDEQMRAIVGPKTKEFGKEKVFRILDGFGVKRIPELNQEQRREFIEKLNAL